MAQIKPRQNKTRRNGRQSPTNKDRVFVLTDDEQRFLKKIGLRISKTLFEQGRPVERLAFELGIARSTLREIIAGRSNTRILTLNAIAKGLGFANILEFLRTL